MLLVLAVIFCTLCACAAFAPSSTKMLPRRACTSHFAPRLSSTCLFSTELKTQLSVDMKEAMKAKEKTKLASIRAIQTAIKQKEVDDRVEVDDNLAIEVMAKLVKSRRESVKSYTDAGRQELAEVELAEIEVIQSYMPAQMTPEEVNLKISEVIASVGATTVKDMGKVMGMLRPMLAGRADMSTVGDQIKSMLK